MITGQQIRQQIIDTSTALLYQAVDANEKEIVGLQHQLAEAQKRIAELEARELLPVGDPPKEFAVPPTNPTVKANGKAKGEK